MKKLFVFLSLLLSITIGTAVKADYSQDIKDKQDQISQNKDKIDDLQGQKSDIQKDKKALQDEIDNLASQISSKADELSSINSSISAVEEKISSLEEDITSINSEIAVKQKEEDDKEALVSERLKSEYMNSSKSAYLSSLLSSRSISEFITKIKYIKSIVEEDNRVINEIALEKEALNAEKEKLVKKQDEIKEERGNLIQSKVRQASVLNSLKDMESDKQSKIEALRGKENSINQKMEDIIEVSSQLENEIKALIKKAEAANQGPKNPSKTMSFIKPTNGVVTSPFGYRIHPITGKRSLHTGVDLANVSGTPIYAAESGTVVTASYLGAYGNAIIIKHNDTYSTLYGHMSGFAVSSSCYVKKGQLIGYMGTTGMSTGPHLHFEIRVNGEYVNPMNYI